jgi:hypothetical protein
VTDDQLINQWKQLEVEVRRTWTELTDEDWALAAGDLGKLADRIHERHADAREVIVQQLAEHLAAATDRARKATDPTAGLRVIT